MVALKAFLKAVPLWAYPMLGLVLACAWLGWSKWTVEKELLTFRQEITQERLDVAVKLQKRQAELDTARAAIEKALQQGRNAVVAAGRAADDRLRAAAQKWAVTDVPRNPGATCVDAGAPIVSVVRDDDRRAFVEAGEGADTDAKKLLACQQWVRDVREKLNGRPQLP